MSSYRNQLRHALYRVYGKKIGRREFHITDSIHERTLGLLVPIDGNMHLPHWLYRYGWKTISYKGVVVSRPLPSVRTDGAVSIHNIPCVHLEVRKLEPVDKEYAKHPMNKPKVKPTLPKGTLPKSD